MNAQTAKRKLQAIVERGSKDTEADHVEADEILCQLLRYLGYSDVVAEWAKVRRWYA